MLLVPKNFLLLLAAIVWIGAGIGVTSVGLGALETPWTTPVAVAFIILFALFFMMFIRVTIKHKKRILGYKEDLKNMFLFFDAQSYILIAVMIFIGWAVRISTLVPMEAIASLYTAIGLALLACSIYYIVTFVSVFDLSFVKYIKKEND